MLAGYSFILRAGKRARQPFKQAVDNDRRRATSSAPDNIAVLVPRFSDNDGVL